MNILKLFAAAVTVAGIGTAGYYIYTEYKERTQMSDNEEAEIKAKLEFLRSRTQTYIHEHKSPISAEEAWLLDSILERRYTNLQDMLAEMIKLHDRLQIKGK